MKGSGIILFDGNDFLSKKFESMRKRTSDQYLKMKIVIYAQKFKEFK